MSEFVEATACTKCQGALVRKDGVFALRGGDRPALEALGVVSQGRKRYPGLCCEDCVMIYPTKEWIDALNGTST
jgi:hypothetical protein